MIKIKPELYNKIKKNIISNRKLFKIITLMYNLLPLIIFIAYPLLIIYLLFTWNMGYIRVIVVPAGTFIAVTIIRIIVNRPRPYEKTGITPLFKKNTKGKSFPSRHVASAFAIAFAFLYINTFLGILFLALAFLISILRPIAGVHYVSDVIFGFLISALFGILFFFIL